MSGEAGLGHAAARAAALLALSAAAGCALDAPAVLGVLRGAVVPDSAETLAVTVVGPEGSGPVRCEADRSVSNVETGARAGSTAELFDEPFSGEVELTGPTELRRGEAEGAVIDGVRPGAVHVFAEGFDSGGRSVGRACGGPVLVAARGVTEIELYWEVY